MSAPKKGGGWGSLFSGAVANLESRLDTILAEDATASTSASASASASASSAAEQASTTKGNRPRTNSGRLAPASAAGSREASRTRVNDRLAERLAKATQQKPPSRVATPVNDAGSGRTSVDTKRSGDAPRSVPDIVEQPAAKTETVVEQGINGKGESKPETEKVEEGTNEGDAVKPVPQPTASLSMSNLPMNPARMSADSPRLSIDAPTPEDASSRPSSDLPNGLISTDPDLQTRLLQMRDDHARAEADRQEEMQGYLERIDALQAKLTYLATETVAAAKAANASAGAGSAEKLLAEKDERIALLMEEGEKLSKSEMKHLQTIKTLRSKTVQADKETSDLRNKLERAERTEVDLKSKLRRSEVAERHASEKSKQIAVIEKQVDELRIDRENAAELVRSLIAQLKDAKEKAARADTAAFSKASEADKSKIASLENELEDAQIEKKLAEDRAAGEVRKAKEEAERQREKLAVRELELKNEMVTMESRLEVLRTHAEEATTSGGTTDGESSVKLMRQVEVLQQQYSLAQGNWETIEASLNARVAALEKERNETSKRESDVRKRARDITARLRKAEEERDEALDQIRNLEGDVRVQREQLTSLQTKHEQAERQQNDLRTELDRQRKLWETDLAQRVEEEKARWRREMLASPRTESPTAFSRKGSSVDIRKPGTSRLTSHDLAALHTEMRPMSRRSSAMPQRMPPSREASPAISRQESSFSFDAQQQHHANNLPATPSIEIGMSEAEYFEDRNSASPQRTLADLVSATSTAGPGGAGPSVQLVERMSALVRKLESEKASFRDELGRLSRQRDAARSEVVELMREVEAKRSDEGKVDELERGMEELKGRYDTSLEILGEKEEEVEELKSDVAELKRIYRELVEAKVGGDSGKK